MDGYLLNPFEFLIRTLFGFYILLVMLRFLLQWVRADFYNPVSQFLVKLTNPPLKLLRRFIPGWGGVDVASIVLMLLLQMLLLALVKLLYGQGFDPVWLVLRSFVELLNLLFNVFIFSILIQAVLSWVNPGTYNPISATLYTLNAPLLNPIRRLIPPVSGFDLSPLVATVGLIFLRMLVIQSLSLAVPPL